MKYQGTVEFVKNVRNHDGSVGHEITFGPRLLEVDAESASDAHDKIRALAKSQWRPRKSQGELMEVNGVRPVEPAPRRWFAFRFSASEDSTARTGLYYGDRDYVAGQLYGFWDRKKRDAWVSGGSASGESRKVVKAGSLPQGWSADYALDPETEELMSFWPQDDANDEGSSE